MKDMLRKWFPHRHNMVFASVTKTPANWGWEHCVQVKICSKCEKYWEKTEFWVCDSTDKTKHHSEHPKSKKS